MKGANIKILYSLRLQFQIFKAIETKSSYPKINFFFSYFSKYKLVLILNYKL